MESQHCRLLHEAIGEIREMKKVDITNGEYMSVSAVIVRCCISMGYPFIHWNGFTERFDVLYLTKIKREEFSKAWELYKEEDSVNDACEEPLCSR